MCNLANICYFHDARIVALAHDYENIRVFVRDESARAILPARHEGFPIKVHYVSGFFNSIFFDEYEVINARGVVRPVMGGVSVGVLGKKVAGTLTFPAYTINGLPVIVSASHVIADEGKAPAGTKIIQPSMIDGGNESNVIGSLYYATPIQYSNANLVDGAVALLNPNVYYSHSVLGVGRINGEAEPYVGMSIKKVGRTTYLTEGRVLAVDGMIKVSGYHGGTAILSDQIIATAFSRQGDSGAPVLDKDNNIVGMLTATGFFYSVITKISNIKSSLSIKLF
jgi:hypothetical protein